MNLLPTSIFGQPIERHTKSLRNNFVKIAESIKKVKQDEEKEFKILEEEKNEISKEGTNLLKEYKQEKESEILAEHSGMHNLAESMLVNQETRLIKDSEEILREIHRLNSEILQAIGYQEDWLGKSNQLTKQMVDNFEILRNNYPSLGNQQSQVSMYHALEVISEFAKQKIQIQEKIEYYKKIKENHINKIKELSLKKNEETKKVISLADKGRKDDNKEKNALKQGELILDKAEHGLE